ncbi:hypothetical protein [Blochmannia endosymbiont of Camponotus nipponensis]|uniref:hypothetical protein n=1 Tax=Blochmannia endosymbiont of Camponotus nipponensis TaxID=2681986 RepID=UPI00135983B0|nr:hypothetical protein [Blochmannia endosymbiont of Camponotus nipponensis]
MYVYIILENTTGDGGGSVAVDLSCCVDNTVYHNTLTHLYLELYTSMDVVLERYDIIYFYNNGENYI